MKKKILIIFGSLILFILISGTQAQINQILWDDSAEYWDPFVMTGETPEPLDLGGTGAKGVGGGNPWNTTISGNYAGNLTFLYVGINPQREWLGYTHYYMSDDIPDNIRIDGYLSLWIYGVNSSSHIAFMVGSYLGENWDVLGVSAGLYDGVMDWIGWRQIKIDLDDFFTLYPGTYNAANFNEVTQITVLFDEGSTEEWGWGLGLDLLEAGESSQQAISQDFSDAAGVMAAFLAVVIIFNLIYIFQTGSVDLIKQIILSWVILMITMLILAAYLLST